MIFQRFTLLLMVLLSVMLMTISCNSARSPESARDIIKGRAYYERAMACIDKDTVQARSHLESAIAADPFHGAAHSNLGTLLYKESRFYEAGIAFETAARLLPGSPEPRANLAMLFLAVNRPDRAVDSGLLSLEISPNFLPAHQAIALALLRLGKTDAQWNRHMQEIAFRSPDPIWSSWAKARLLQSQSLPPNDPTTPLLSSITMPTNATHAIAPKQP